MEDKSFYKRCVDCNFFDDAGPVSAHLAGIEGICKKDGHKISGALQQCDVDNHNELNHKLNGEVQEKTEDLEDVLERLASEKFPWSNEYYEKYHTFPTEQYKRNEELKQAYKDGLRDVLQSDIIQKPGY